MTSIVQERGGSGVGISGVLLDLGGVIYVGDAPIEGAIDAVKRLRDAGLPLRFITNTTRRCKRQVREDLARMGVDLSGEELLTPALLARAHLETHGLSPFLLVHPDLEEDFAGLASSGGEAVIVGDAGETFTYDRLNRAYRKLIGGAEFLALAMNRNFKDADGELSLDAGPFVAALEFAANRKAMLFGKPSAEFFGTAVHDLRCPIGAVVMIGDDAEADVGGAIAVGLKGILVRTGKYRQGDENKLHSRPDYVAETLDEAVEWILVHR
ncbi:MAG: TIGR01458 family HAD-type hydrolase [Proteobacteria bacterium]|nr:TIGR01458 family HAD-type hydrolase [Pseudomonadota bacterium]